MWKNLQCHIIGWFDIRVNNTPIFSVADLSVSRDLETWLAASCSRERKSATRLSHRANTITWKNVCNTPLTAGQDWQKISCAQRYCLGNGLRLMNDEGYDISVQWVVLQKFFWSLRTGVIAVQEYNKGNVSLWHDTRGMTLIKHYNFIKLCMDSCTHRTSTTNMRKKPHTKNWGAFFTFSHAFLHLLHFHRSETRKFG